MQQVTLVTADYREIAIPNNQDTVESAVLTGRFHPTDGREPGELPVREIRYPIRRYRKADGSEAVCAFDEGMQEIVDAEWQRCRDDFGRLDVQLRNQMDQRALAVRRLREIERMSFWQRLRALFTGVRVIDALTRQPVKPTAGLAPAALTPSPRRGTVNP